MWTRKLANSRLFLATLLAVLYVLTGKLGLLLAVPPGYATIIWPASGIATGMLIIYGWRLWPGILIGSFVLNVYNAAPLEAGGTIDVVKVLTSLGIASGSTIQALVAQSLVRYALGSPVALKNVKALATLLLVAGPLACVVAATIGVATLAAAGAMPMSSVGPNWITWWAGDMLGVFVFMPLVLVWPGSRQPITWRGQPLGRLSALAMLALVAPLALTFYTWKITSENNYEQGRAEFASLATESEDALRFRMTSYDYALIGAAAYYQGKKAIGDADWRTYVETLNITSQFPGINGVGIIEPVEPGGEDAFLARFRAQGRRDFRIHPAAPGRPLLVISHIEPLEPNRAALGLNIGFEDNRLEAATLSRDTGQPAITKKITLVQDSKQTPGFLMLRPLYRPGEPTATVEQRTQALFGWVYAPFIASNLLGNLTPTQGRDLRLQLYDGGKISPETLIYDSGASIDADAPPPAHTVTKSITIMQQNWLAVWSSTPAFDRENSSGQAVYVLVGGLLFTGLLALFLILGSVRRTDTIEWMLREQKYAAPGLIFILVLGGAAYLQHKVRSQEIAFAKVVVDEQADNIALLISSSVNDELMALKRMGQRWESARGTPEAQWREDARSFVDQLGGLRAVEWVDSNYRVRWVEPEVGNERAIGLNVLFDETRAEALRGAARTEAVTVTPPLDLVQGYRALIAYAPIHIDGQFGGFIAGIFASDQFLAGMLNTKITESFAISLEYEGQALFHRAPSEALASDFAASRNVSISGTEWRLTVTPTQKEVRSRFTLLPGTLLGAGVLFAALLALTFRAILLSRVKSAYLQESNELNGAILSSSAYLIIATGNDGGVVLFNKAAEKELGYSADDVMGLSPLSLWHEPAEIAVRAAELSDELGRAVDPSEVLTAAPQLKGIESRRWTYVRKTGEAFPVNLTVTTLKDEHGAITGYLGVAEDISERVEREMALRESEETFRSAMNSSPIGMGLGSPQGRWLKVSPTLCELFGLSEDEMFENDFSTLSYEEDIDKTADLIGKAVRGEIDSYQLEKRYYHRSGRIIWALVNASLVRNSDGAPKYFVVQIQDITERKEMERMKSEFVSVVSHELRTPLTSVRGSLGLIIGTMANELPGKADRLLQIAHSNCERLILLINDILDIDKIASGQMRFRVEQRNVAALVHKAVEANSAYADKLSVRYEVMPIDDKLCFDVDEDRFIQVLSNLLSNAAKFSPEGGAVRVSAEVLGARVRIAVADDGPGIPEGFRSRIFGKFSQADSSNTRAKGGTGLGLHISRQLVEHMGGDIGFDSQEGKGSTFWVDFNETHQAHELTAPASGANVTPEPADELPTLLHIEDDADFSQFLATALNGKAKLVRAATVGEALKLLDARRFDMLVLDIALPDGDGLTLVPKFRSANPKAPVAILSADEAPQAVLGDVAAAMVKSRRSEASIVSTIHRLLSDDPGLVTEAGHV